MTKISTLQTANPSCKSLYKVGAVAALVAALGFRRNLGAAEIPLLTRITPPSSVDGWFTLLHTNPLLGLTLLNVFDIANYVLVAVMFLALYIALRQTNKSYTLIAATLSFFGAGIYIVSNSALSMLSLSYQYAVATTDAQKSTMLAAGHVVLASGYNPGAVYQSSGFYLSLSFVAVAGIIMSIVMLQSGIFGKATAFVGVVAGFFDLAYLIGLLFVPTSDVAILGVICIAAAGLLLMVWHLMIGVKLYQLSRVTHAKGSVNE